MKNAFKFSRYNVLFHSNGKDYLWNTFSDALIELTNSEAACLKNTQFPAPDLPYFDTLYDNGCIIDKGINELNKVLIDEKSVMLQHNPEAMYFTIAPGFKCNYDCVYCFEKDRFVYKKMSDETIDKVCSFIINSAENNPMLKIIKVNWFGGEPLLYKSIIKEISNTLMGYCEKRGVKYTASIVTNGRFLDPDTASMLKKLNVCSVQLSFDGTKDVYVKKKRASSEDFDATVSNICNCADIIPITVRINIDDDVTDAVELTSFFLKDCGLDRKIKIYIAHIRDYTCSDAETEADAHGRFLDAQEEYMKLFREKFSAESFCYIPPARRYTTCPTVCRKNFCIGPDGELYRCEHFFGKPERIVGTVYDGLYNNQQDMQYLLFRHPAKCLECEMLPICLGGCMNDAMNGNISLSCNKLKNRWIELLMLEHTEEKGEMV